MSQGPKVLFLDIETSPMLAYVWSLWGDQNIGINQIQKDWFILSWAAKWLGESKVMYMDQRQALNPEDDGKILKHMWKLLDEADIIVTQNGKKFDAKKLNARFILNGYKPPSSYKHIDTYVIAKKHFGFSSNKLEYLSKNLGLKHKKLTERKFSGFELWKECLSGNLKAWKEMEKYNKLDVLALEELYNKLLPWDKGINYNLYSDSLEPVCTCGSKSFKKNGYSYTASGKHQRYYCKVCGSETRDKKNLLSIEKIRTLRKATR